MYDAKGDVIYVGKARNLKNRVSSYTRLWGHTSRIAAMISLTVNMEFVTTATEAEALLLEANLIKKLKPRFNVVLRDDKSFPYILIAKDHAVAQLVKHRGARNRKGSYYGPFASAGAVNRAINTLQKAFLLRSCNDSVYANRTRPCLLYQIKRCSAPCVNYIKQQPYDELVKEAEAFLNGKSQAVKADLARQMEEAAEALDFERAALCRDRIQAMSFVTQTPGHQSAIGGGGGCLRPRAGGRADLHPGVLLPLLPELGQPRLLPQGRQEPRRAGDPRRLHGPVL